MRNKWALVLWTLPSLSFCHLNIFTYGETFSWEPYLNNTTGMSAQSDKFKYYSFTDCTSEVADLENKLDSAISSGSLNKFAEYYNSLSSYYLTIIDDYVISSTKYYANSSNASLYEKANSYYEQYTNLRQYLIGLEEDIYRGPNAEIKEYYFGDMTDSQIEARLNENEGLQIQAEYDAKFRDYKDAAQLLYNQYSTGQITQDSYLDKGYESFIDYINTTKELLTKVDYDNYLDYSYTLDFQRDYNYEQAQDFVSNVKKYLVPIYKQAKELTAPEGINNSLLYGLNSLNFCNRTTDSASMMSKYAEFLGGQYLALYNNAWGNGYWCFTDSSSSLGTAYEWQLYSQSDAVLYFSKNYQKVLTVTHEFGHYYGAISNGGTHANDPMDIAETYSQANEFTFLNFLVNEKKDSQDYETYKFFADNYAYKNLYYIIQEACVTEIEIYAYTTPNLTKNSLRSGVENILASYNGTANQTYFMGACLMSPCYYVSYATSLIEALQFFACDYETAKNMYINLIEYQSGNTMVEIWESAGLSSPFDENSIKNIATMLSEM